MFGSIKITIAIVIMAGLLLTACNSKKKNGEGQSKEIKPQTPKIEGYLGDYLEVVDGTYKVEADNQFIFNWSVKVKLKAKSPYNEDDYGFKDGSFGPLHLDLFDEKGSPITGFDNLRSDFNDDAKIADILKKGSGETWVTFLKSHNYGKEELDPNISTFAINSQRVEKKEKSSDETTYPSEKTFTVESEDWDKLISDYKDYMHQYIKLLKKANNGDASALSEYPGIYEKAGEIATQIEAAKGKDISPKQMARFVKIETDFTTEIMKLK